MAEGQSQPGPGLAQCAVTQLWFPQDELVTIDGKQVCAEGKAILLEQLKRGESGGMERPSAWRRWGASIVDGLVLMPLGCAGGAIIAAMGSQGSSSISQIEGTFNFVLYTCFLAYLVFMHGTTGQTVGKKVAKIKVVNLDGSPLTMQTAFIRGLAYFGIQLTSFLLTALGLKLFGAIIAGIGVVWVIVLIVMLLSDSEKQQGLHDRIAKTRVILVR